jgi:glycosyltransferase involved in cell wall biosynthesis
MRVLMLSKALVVASYRTKLAELSQLGVDVIAIVPESWKEAGQIIAFEPHEHTGYKILRTSIAWNGHYHIHYYPALNRIVRDVQPDIIHIDEEPYNLATYLAIRSGQSVGARSLFFTWQNIKRRYPPPYRQIEQYVYKHAAFGLAGSQESLEILRTKGFAGRTRIIPQFGVDTHAFSPGRERSGPFTVCFLGRLVSEKGIAELMSAFATIEPPARLIIAGEGPLAEYVERSGADLKQQGRLETHPRIHSNEVPGLLHRIDVLALPSRTTPRWREQYGRILVEAMASGVVVVGSDSGEIPNVIGDAGIIVAERDSRALGQALQQLAESVQLRRDLRKRGRARVEAMFSQAGVAAQTAEVYNEMMSKT